MFENDQTQSPPPPPPAGAAGGSPSAFGQDVHTMPERFMEANMPPTGKGPRGGSVKKIIIAAVSAVVLGGLGAGAWYYFTRLSSTNENINTTATTNSLNSNRNVNSNLNSNANSNLNANANLNANVNSNLNSNANSNLNANLNSNTNTTLSTTGSPLPSSTDTDDDGLTDLEEQVYGTQSNNNDTDGDGFIDGSRVLANGKSEGEVNFGYCPTKLGNIRLDDATCRIMRTYTNNTFGYALWVPQNWLTQATGGDDKTVIITPDIATSEFFQVNVLDNPSQLTAKNYYLNLNPGIDPSKIVDITTNGLDGVLSLDASTAYFVRGTRIYAVSYNTATLNRVNLRTTFETMYRSFRLVAGTSTNSNANSNTNTSGTINTNSGTTTNTNSSNSNSSNTNAQ